MSSLREDRIGILEALIEGEKSRDDLLKSTNIKPTRLHDRLNFLLKLGEIEAYDNPEDRRITMYRIAKEKEEKATTQLIAEEFKARVHELFKEASFELVVKLLTEFQFWLKEQGYEELAMRASKYEIEDRGDTLILRNRKTGSILPIVIHKETTRPKVGNLKGERNKAFSRFLQKHYPSVKTPVHDLENSKLVMKIKKEFEEYWKKEYWEEDVGEKKS